MQSSVGEGLSGGRGSAGDPAFRSRLGCPSSGACRALALGLGGAPGVDALLVRCLPLVFPALLRDFAKKDLFVTASFYSF